MVLRGTIDDREYDKFVQNDDGDTAVRTLTTGTITPSGLRNGWRVTTMDVTDTATLVPASALLARNSISIQNLSDTDTLYLGPDASVTPDQVLGVTAGHEVGPGESWNTDITDQIAVYGIVALGKTVRIKITELS